MAYPGSTTRSSLHMLTPGEIPPVLNEVMDVRVALARPTAAIFRGPLLTAPALAYERVAQAFPEHILILDEDSEVGARLSLLHSPPQNLDRTHPFVAGLLLILTVLTTTIAGAVYARGSLTDGWAVITNGLPYAIGLMSILGVHELGHFFAAKRHAIAVSLPYFIPAPFALGTFGAFIRLKSPAPDRPALFDMAVAGPLAGLCVAIPVLVLGLRSSELSATPFLLSQLGEPSANASLLFGLIARATIDAPLTPQSVVILSPLAFAGWLGLYVTALNLIPVGQLDGGHIIQAMFGSRMAGAISSLALSILFLIALFFLPQLLLWALVVFAIAGRPAPPKNDLVPLSLGRKLIGWCAILLFLSIVVPYPG